MKKRVIIIVAIIAAILALFTALYIKEQNDNQDKNTQAVEVYFVNPSTHNIESERRILQSIEPQNKVSEMLNILTVTGPLNKSLKLPSSSPFTLLGSSVIGDTAIVYFDENYNAISSPDKIYLKSTITWSLTSIDGINSVIFYVGEDIIKTGEDVSSTEDNIEYDRGYVYLDPTIDPQNPVLISLKLYFIDKTSNKLVLEQRSNIYANPNITREYYIVDELIKGTTTEGSYSAIPKGTKLINVETDNSICYVNLSSDFVSKQPNDEAMNRLSVYQLVNSLTLLDNVDAVQIFIDSKKVEGFKNGVDLSESLQANDFYNDLTYN